MRGNVFFATNDRELMEAIGKVNDGDTIQLAGTFSPIIWNKDGKQGSSITIESKFHDAPAVIQSNGEQTAFEFAGAARKYITLKDIIIDGAGTQTGVKMVGHPEDRNNRHRHIRFIGCTIRNCRLGAQVMRANFVRFIGCTITDCYTTREDGHAHGVFAADCGFLSFDRCRIIRCGLDPHRPEGRNVFSHGIYCKAGQQRETLERLYVRKCIFYDCGSWSLTFSTEDSNNPGYIYTVRVLENVFAGSANGIVSGGRRNTARDVVIQHNTFIDLGREPSGIPQAFGVEIHTAEGDIDLRITGNVFERVNKDLPETATIKAIHGLGQIAGNTFDPSWKIRG